MANCLIFGVQLTGPSTTELVTRLTKSPTFRVVPFDTRAAIELALMTRSAIDQGEERGGVDAPWNKIKFDREIVAIAKVAGATVIYSMIANFVPLPKNMVWQSSDWRICRYPESPNFPCRCLARTPMQKKNPSPKADNKAQHERFIETARQLECDEDKERFEEKLKRIAKAKPSPDKRNEK